MTRVYNFSAGPAALPETVLRQAAEEMLDWHGSGMSVMEMSHRGKEFIAIADEAQALLRELMAIPANYKVLFMQGGAIAENAIVPMNLLRGHASADYVDIKPFAGAATIQYRRWAGINWIVSPLVTGVGTASELLYIWHRDALGYAINVGEDSVYAGFNAEQGRNWARAEVYHEAVVLQNSGIIKITHDGSGFAAT